MQTSSRKAEQELTLLGSKTNSYPDDYAPEVLETFENKHQEMITSLNLTVLNLRVYVP